MGKDIQFSVDRTKAKEGESVVVSWNCDSPDAVSLAVDNGYTSYNVQLADSGSRPVTIEQSKGKTLLRLNVVYNGKVERKELSVKVEKVKAAKAPKTRTARKPLRNPFRNFRSNWNSFCYRLRYGWQAMPQKKRRNYSAILIALALIWLFTIARTCGYQAGYRNGVESAPQTTSVTV